MADKYISQLTDASALSGSDNQPRLLRVFWAVRRRINHKEVRE